MVRVDDDGKKVLNTDPQVHYPGDFCLGNLADRCIMVPIINPVSRLKAPQLEPRGAMEGSLRSELKSMV